MNENHVLVSDETFKRILGIQERVRLETGKKPPIKTIVDTAMHIVPIKEIVKELRMQRFIVVGSVNKLKEAIEEALERKLSLHVDSTAMLEIAKKPELLKLLEEYRKKMQAEVEAHDDDMEKMIETNNEAYIKHLESLEGDKNE